MKFTFTIIVLLSIMSLSAITCILAAEKTPVLNWSASSILTLAGEKAAIGLAGPVTGLVNQKLVIAGGANFPNGLPWRGGQKAYYNEAFVIDGDCAKIEAKIIMPYPVAYAGNCNVPNGIASVGGENATGPLKDVLLTSWVNGKVNFTKLPPLPVAITNASAAAVDDIVYAGGGETPLGTSARFYKLDLKDLTSGWQALKNIPVSVSHMTLVSSGNGRDLYLMGGRCKTTSGISIMYNRTFMYNTGSDTWIEKARLPYPLSAASALLVNNRQIALFGGDKGQIFTQIERLLRAAKEEPDSLKKDFLTKEKERLQLQHPGFSNSILLYDLFTDGWEEGGAAPFNIGVTTTAVKSGKRIWIPTGEIKPGIRSPLVLMASVD